MKRLVLLGGGHAHVHVLQAMGEALDPSVSVTLITPVERQLYSGMLPGFVAGHYRLEECAIALGPLARRARALVVSSAATLVNPGLREVICANGEVVPYDVLSLDVGALPLVGTAEGVARHAIPVRPLERLLQGWERVLDRAKSGAVSAVSIVGGGAGGIELALAMDHRFRTLAGKDAPHVRVLTDADTFLPGYPTALRGRLLRLAQQRGIGLHARSPVAFVGADSLRLREPIEFATDATFWVTGAAAHGFIAASGLRTDERGFLAVDDCFRSVSHADIFGAGDCATNVANPRAKAGVFAVRSGPALAANLLAALRGEPLKPHVTSRRHLALISCGSRYAVGAYGPLTFEGKWAWRWKDRIDRAFIARYTTTA